MVISDVEQKDTKRNIILKKSLFVKREDNIGGIDIGTLIPPNPSSYDMPLNFTHLLFCFSACNIETGKSSYI